MVGSRGWFSNRSYMNSGSTLRITTNCHPPHSFAHRFRLRVGFPGPGIINSLATLVISLRLKCFRDHISDNTCNDMSYSTCYDTCYSICYDTCYSTCYDTCYSICYNTCYGTICLVTSTLL